ncbi:sugar nucleotide-binding protein [Streptomyces sp. st77]|uniref:sugar nucleotide-binding protein n=1 Tax=Streptomyces sp. st77 TaxID=1828074 RepID=UPI000BFE3D00
MLAAGASPANSPAPPGGGPGGAGRWAHARGVRWRLPSRRRARRAARGTARYDESCLPGPITPYGAAKAAAETGILAVHPKAVVARTSLIIGHGLSVHERLVHELAAGTTDGALYTDDIRCPVHVSDLASALLELADGSAAGIHHVAGPDALSRHQLGVLIAERDGLDASRLPTGQRADSTTPGPLDIRLDSQATQRHLRTRLRGAREFLR